MTVEAPASSRGPVLDLELPAASFARRVVLRNITAGTSLTLNLDAGWDGSDLRLDFYRRTIRDQAGVDRSALLDPVDNRLWSMNPLISGPNDLRLEASGASLLAADGFDQSAGNLTGKSTGTGDLIYTAAGKSDVDDFTIDAVGHRAQRTALGDASENAGRGVLLGAGKYTDVLIGATFSTSALRPGYQQGLLLRCVDLDNCLRLVMVCTAYSEVLGATVRFAVIKRVAGVSTTFLIFKELTGIKALPFTQSLEFEIRGDEWRARREGNTEGAGKTDPDLAPGKALDDGGLGIYDAWTPAVAATRTIDSLSAVDFLGAAPYGAKATLRWENAYY